MIAACQRSKSELWDWQHGQAPRVSIDSTADEDEGRRAVRIELTPLGWKPSTHPSISFAQGSQVNSVVVDRPPVTLFIDCGHILILNLVPQHRHPGYKFESRSRGPPGRPRLILRYPAGINRGAGG